MNKPKGTIKEGLKQIDQFMDIYKKIIYTQHGCIEAIEQSPTKVSFVKEPTLTYKRPAWIKENNKKYLNGTKNEYIAEIGFLSQMGYITALEYSPDGSFMVVGHSSGLVQVRDGFNGGLMGTIRKIQLPHQPVYSIDFSKAQNEKNVCYTTSTDGTVFRIRVPTAWLTGDVASPELHRRTSTQYIVTNRQLQQLSSVINPAPVATAHSSPVLTNRIAALSASISADNTTLLIGYLDSSVKTFDVESEKVTMTHKVQKQRLGLIPKTLQRRHTEAVCAVCCSRDDPMLYATASWDQTVRIWDLRCSVGCMMTYEGVNVCSNSIDISRNLCITGSWQATDALALFDVVAAKKRLYTVKVQNRRAEVDGEYIYACRFWHSSDFNRKGKYAIIGGSGTSCVEVINLHNRYISCSYPHNGSVLAVTSYQDRIAYGGTATELKIVTFHDPKHEKEAYDKCLCETDECKDICKHHGLAALVGTRSKGSFVDKSKTGLSQGKPGLQFEQEKTSKKETSAEGIKDKKVLIGNVKFD